MKPSLDIKDDDNVTGNIDRLKSEIKTLKEQVKQMERGQRKTRIYKFYTKYGKNPALLITDQTHGIIWTQEIIDAYYAIHGHTNIYQNYKPKHKEISKAK